MKQINEGVIKFKYSLKRSTALAEEDYLEIEKWRSILFRMGLIGEYEIEKVGYGNLSKRIITGKDEFIITGTQTGKYPNLDGSQYTKIMKCNYEKMSVEAVGPIAPSSESLTHYAIYHQVSHVNFVFHVHNSQMWQFMLDQQMDATPEEIDYGTKEMANYAAKLIGQKESGIFVMAGHQDGIISYGSTAQEAGKILLDTLKHSRQNPS